MKITSTPIEDMPAGNGVLKHVSGKSGILSDHNFMFAPTGVTGPQRFLKTCAEARPSFNAVSAVTGSRLAVPRTPSVPKIFGQLLNFY